MAATEDMYQAWYRLYGVCVCRRADARLVLLIHAGGRFVLDLGVEVTSDVGKKLIRCVAFESDSASLFQQGRCCHRCATMGRTNM